VRLFSKSPSAIGILVALLLVLVIPPRAVLPPRSVEWPTDRPLPPSPSVSEQVDQWAASLKRFSDPDPAGDLSISSSSWWPQQHRALLGTLTRMQARAAAHLSKPSGQSQDLAMRIAVAAIHRKAARMARPPEPRARRDSRVSLGEDLDPLQAMIAEAARASLQTSSLPTDSATVARFARWMTKP